MSNQLSLTVNGRHVTIDLPPETTLVELLREHLRLTGTHVGCDTTQCGACTVLLDGQPVKGCSVLALQADGMAVTSIEGLAAEDGTLHPMQAAFKEHHGLQCGFCTPGMVMSACGLALRAPPGKVLSHDDIRQALEGNICRCTGYHNIVRAVKSGLDAMSQSSAPSQAAA
jgi:carbon-monoxide dehydrogenase small subunit